MISRFSGRDIIKVLPIGISLNYFSNPNFIYRRIGLLSSISRVMSPIGPFYEITFLVFRKITVKNPEAETTECLLMELMWQSRTCQQIWKDISPFYIWENRASIKEIFFRKRGSSIKLIENLSFLIICLYFLLLQYRHILVKENDNDYDYYSQQWWQRW